MSLDYQILLKSPPPKLTDWIRPCRETGVGQPFDFLVIQNRQSTHSIGRSMDWTVEDNMVTSLFCVMLTSRRKDLVSAGAVSEAVKPDPYSILGRQGCNDVRCPQGKSKFGAPMFQSEIFRNQLHCIQESTCDIVETFRRPHNH